MAAITTNLLFAAATNVPVTFGDDWLDPTNVFVSDDLYARAIGGGLTDYLDVTKGNIDFVFSPDSIILGVASKTEAKIVSGTALYERLIINGIATGDTKGFLVLGEAVYTVGSALDTWGLTLSSGAMHATNFGIRVYSPDETRGDIFYIDQVYLAVTHDPGRMMLCM